MNSPKWGQSLRPRQAAECLGISTSTLWRRRTERQDMPRARRLSSRCNVFDHDELMGWRDAHPPGRAMTHNLLLPPPSSPSPSSLDRPLLLPLTCQQGDLPSNLFPTSWESSAIRTFSVRWHPLGQCVGGFEQLDGRARPHGGRHCSEEFGAGLGPPDLQDDHASIGQLRAVLARVLAPTVATGVDAAAHLGCGERKRFCHRSAFHVTLTCQLHMWALDGDKSKSCGAKVDLQENHCRSVRPSVLAGAKNTIVHGSIMGPVLDTKWRDRVSEGLRG